MKAGLLRLGIAVFVTTVGLAGTAMGAGDVKAGKEKAVAVCGVCHGVDGNSQIPAFPRIAGQHEEYLRHALDAYRNGSRKNEVMKAQAGLLTPVDVVNVAAYFASQKGLEVKR